MSGDYARWLANETAAALAHDSDTAAEQEDERHFCTDYELCEECHLCDGCCACAPKRAGTYDTGEWDRWIASRQVAASPAAGKE